MSDEIGHHCGVAMVRLLRPPEYFQDRYGSAAWGLARMYLLLEKQRNRGQDGAGVACVQLGADMGEPVYHIKRAPGREAIDAIFGSFGHGSRAESGGPTSIAGTGGDEAAPASLEEFTSELYLGHVRYGTAGDNSARSCHPRARHSNWPSRTLILAGNFNLTNAEDLFEELIGYGQHPVASSDTSTVMEKIGHFLDRENDRLYRFWGPDSPEPLDGQDLADKIGRDIDLVRVLRSASKHWDGGFVFGGLLGHGDAFVCRDRCGIRPCYYVTNDEYFAAASERAALVNVFGVSPDEVEELTPGHCIVIKRDGRIIAAPFVDENVLTETTPTPCSFERIYFSRGNDSQIYQERKALGRMLARRVLELVDWDVENTVFSYIPNTSETAFLGLVQESERLLQERQAEEAVRLLESGAATVEGIRPIFSQHLRVEKVAHKDQKLRTFITDDEHRSTLVAHAYDVTPGVVKQTDTLVVMDDSIVRGTTLRDSVIHMLAGLNPRRIVVVSSAPPIKYPDCYGIDMSELRKFVAFQAATEILRARGDANLLDEVYQSCLAQREAALGSHQNHVRRIYESITDEELSARIAEIVRPVDVDWSGELNVMYQTVEALHASIPAHQGDWYFTGRYPTPGGYKVLNTSYIFAHEGRSGRAYSNRRASRERGARVPTGQG